MDTRTEMEQIKELLGLGRLMGSGERYLILYEGILSITNRTGMACWPRGNRQTIALFDACDCVRGLTAQQWNEILGRLQRIRMTCDAEAEEEHGYERGRDRIAEQAPKPYQI